MKRTIKIICINIILICILIIITELVCCITKKEFLSNATISHLQNMMKVQYSSNSDIQEFRYRYIPTISNNNQKYSSKSPIILMGGSFTYGYGLNDKETFDAQLKRITQRDIYNFGINGGGPKEILITLQNSELMNKITQTPEYIIYTYIPDHKRRMYVPLAFLNANYKPINNYSNLKYYIPNKFIYKSFMYETTMNSLYKYNIIPKERSEMFFNLYMEEINNEIKRRFGDKTKFIILIYYGEESHNWNTIKDMGIKVIDINTLWNIDTQQPEYKGFDQEHPNAKAWDVIVPALVKELDL